MDIINDLLSSRYLNLKSINRYSNKFMVFPESTATHTIECQLIALWMYDRLVQLGVKLDKKDLMYRCLMHDLDESVMCDLPRDIKYHDDKFLSRVNEIAHELLVKSGISEDVLFDIEHAKHDCIEGELVGFIDVLQALLKIEVEYKLQTSDQLLKMIGESLGYLREKLEYMKHSNDTITKFLSEIIDSANVRYQNLVQLHN